MTLSPKRIILSAEIEYNREKSNKYENKDRDIKQIAYIIEKELLAEMEKQYEIYIKTKILDVHEASIHIDFEVLLRALGSLALFAFQNTSQINEFSKSIN